MKVVTTKNRHLLTDRFCPRCGAALETDEAGVRTWCINKLCANKNGVRDETEKRLQAAYKAGEKRV